MFDGTTTRLPVNLVVQSNRLTSGQIATQIRMLPTVRGQSTVVVGTRACRQPSRECWADTCRAFRHRIDEADAEGNLLNDVPGFKDTLICAGFRGVDEGTPIADVICRALSLLTSG